MAAWVNHVEHNFSRESSKFLLFTNSIPSATVGGMKGQDTEATT
jgi:hypothetical protein